MRDQLRWSNYFKATRGRPPRETLLQGLEIWSSREAAIPGHALDLGCGVGRDTAELLDRGWSVEAIDQSAEAIEELCTWRHPRLTARRADFEVLESLPSCDLLNASFCLPFCSPDHFPRLWRAISQALKSGGLFCGQLFGPKDDWADGGITVHRREDLERLVGSDFELLFYQEEDEEGTTANGQPKHWHIHHLILEKQ